MTHRYQAQLTGLRRLLALDPEYIKSFAATPAGFWQAFWLLPLSMAARLVGDLLLAFSPPSPDDTPLALSSFLKQLALENLATIILWALYPLLVVYLSRSFGVGKNYFRYMVPYLWFTALLPVTVLPCDLLAWAGLLPGGQALAIEIFVYIIGAGYMWFLAWKGLLVGGWTAAGLVLLNIAVTGVVSSAALKLNTIALPF